MPSKLTFLSAATKALALTSLCAAGLGILTSASCADTPAGVETVTVVPLDRDDPSNVTVGELTFLAGFELDLDDPMFGGLSGLEISADGQRLTAVSDNGWWLTADLEHDDLGRLTAVQGLKLQPLLDLDSKPFSAQPGDLPKIWGDAESVAQSSDDSMLVAFERRHRLWSYDQLDAVPTAIGVPEEVNLLKSNHSLESVDFLSDGRILIFAEEPIGDDQMIMGWVLEDEAWREIAYQGRDDFNVTDMTVLADGRIIVLERWFVPPVFLKTRLREFTTDMLADNHGPIDGRVLATFTNSLLIDNFEGLTARPAPDGGYWLYMVSDDNYNSYQRTLLYQFYLGPR